MGCPTPIGPRPRFIPVALTAKVTMTYLLDGQTVENVYHVKGSSEWDATTLDALTTAFENWETTHGTVMRGTDAILISVTAEALFIEDGPVFFSTVSISGILTNDLLPNNVTIAIKWVTGIRGRSFRGRTYHIGVTNDMVTTSGPNHINGAWVTGLLNHYGALLLVTYPNSGQLCVVSYAHDCTWRSAGVATPIIAARLTDTVLDSQRRRLPSHNIHH